MIKKKTITQRMLTTLLSVFAAMMFSFTADAASACKGKSQASCSADSNCSWVSGFKRKDGVKVSAHCRASAGKANKKSTSKKQEKKVKKEKSTKSKKTASDGGKSMKKDKKKAKKTKDKKVKKEKKAKKSKDKKSAADTAKK